MTASVVDVESIKVDMLKSLLQGVTLASEECICSTWHLFPGLSAEQLKVLVDGLSTGTILPPRFMYIKSAMVGTNPSHMAWCASFEALHEESAESKVCRVLVGALSEEVRSAVWDSFLGAWVLH